MADAPHTEARLIALDDLDNFMFIQAQVLMLRAEQLNRSIVTLPCTNEKGEELTRESNREVGEALEKVVMAVTALAHLITPEQREKLDRYQ